MKITVDLHNEEIVNIIIRSYTEEVLEMSLEEKQQFLVRNGLADVVSDDLPMPNPADILKPPTVCLCNPITKGEFEYTCEHGTRF